MPYWGWCLYVCFVCVCVCVCVLVFLMIRQPPRSTLERSSAASDVYKRQVCVCACVFVCVCAGSIRGSSVWKTSASNVGRVCAVSYTHLRAHETGRKLV